MSVERNRLDSIARFRLRNTPSRVGDETERGQIAEAKEFINAFYRVLATAGLVSKVSTKQSSSFRAGKRFLACTSFFSLLRWVEKDSKQQEGY